MSPGGASTAAWCRLWGGKMDEVAELDLAPGHRRCFVTVLISSSFVLICLLYF